MTEYQVLTHNPPKISIKKDAREVVFNTTASMCDNKHTITFKKRDDGDFGVSGGRFALSNWGMKNDLTDLRWAADDQNWPEVVRIINSGYEVVSSVRSR